MLKDYFEITNSSYIKKKYKDFLENLDNCRFSYDIWECYQKPSYTKVKVWESWEDWAKENKAILYINGYCSMNFSICGYIEENKDKYFLYITKDHNRALKLEA